MWRKSFKENDDLDYMVNVTLYTTPTCQWCGKTKEFFKQHKIRFTEVDLMEDRAAYDRVVNHTHQLSVPVVEIGETWVVGFHPEAMLQAIKVQNEQSPSPSAPAPFVPMKVVPRTKSKVTKDPLTKPNPSKIPPWMKK